MLWYKSWLETRYRMLQVLGMLVVLLAINIHKGSSSPDRERFFFILLPIVWPMTSALLAGAGIRTQAALQATKGLHGSMYFTLSLPVSRLRLLAVRSGLGLLEMAGIIAAFAFGAWAIISGLRSLVAPVEYLLTIATCVSSFYFLSVLLATFLDDMWRIWASFIAIGLIRVLFMIVQVPPSLNIFGAMGESSPLFTHTLPWTTMGVSLLIAALLFFAALKVVQVREY